MSVPTMPRRLDVRQIAIWTAVAILGAVAWAVLALARGESVNAVWMLFAALCSYAIAYRFYARFIANRVLGVDNRRATPAERLDNAVDFHKTDRRGLFGHHCVIVWQLEVLHGGVNHPRIDGKDEVAASVSGRLKRATVDGGRAVGASSGSSCALRPCGVYRWRPGITNWYAPGRSSDALPDLPRSPVSSGRRH
jgi:hypothetical protein